MPESFKMLPGAPVANRPRRFIGDPIHAPELQVRKTRQLAYAAKFPHVIIGHLRVGMSGALAMRDAVLSRRVLHIVCCGADKEMGGVEATAVVAMVAREKRTSKIKPKPEMGRDSVNRYMPENLGHPHTAVAVVMTPPRPVPTAVLVNTPMRKDAIRQRCSWFGVRQNWLLSLAAVT